MIIYRVEHAPALTAASDETLDDEIIFARTLISRCARLVTFNESGQLVFSHYTIFGYFVARSNHLFGNGHRYMAETCVPQLPQLERNPTRSCSWAGGRCRI